MANNDLQISFKIDDKATFRNYLISWMTPDPKSGEELNKATIYKLLSNTFPDIYPKLSINQVIENE